MMTKSALERQIAGDHYKTMKIQPMTYSLENGLNAAQHSAVKYVTRYRSGKGSPLENLRKAIHSIELLIEQEALTELMPYGHDGAPLQKPFAETEAFAVDLGEKVMDAIYRRVDEAVAARIRDATPEETVITTVDIGGFVRKLKSEEFINTRNRDFVEGSATYGLIKEFD